MDANFGPVGSSQITFRWTKNVMLAIAGFIILWSILAPDQFIPLLREVGFDQFKEFAINENLPIALIREWVTDALFSILGFASYWMIARYMNNTSTNPVILFLRVFGLQNPDGDSRSLPDSEESIHKGYHEMLKKIQYV